MTDIIAKLKTSATRLHLAQQTALGPDGEWLNAVDAYKNLLKDPKVILALIETAEALELSLKSINDCDCGVIDGGTPPHINTCAFVIAEPALVKMRALREGKL